MANLHKIIRLLPQLDLTELAELEQRVKLLKATGHAVASAAGTPLESDESLVLHCISELLQRLGLGYSTLALLQKSVTEKLQDGHSFRDKVPGLMLFLQRQHPRRTGQRALLAYGLELMYFDYLHGGGVISHKTLMANIHRIPLVLDNHFPGYARANLLHLIVDQRRHRQLTTPAAAE